MASSIRMLLRKSSANAPSASPLTANALIVLLRLALPCQTFAYLRYNAVRRAVLYSPPLSLAKRRAAIVPALVYGKCFVFPSAVLTFGILFFLLG